MLLTQWVWLLGLAAQLLGVALQAAALDRGRVSIIQPLLVTSVIWALPLGYFMTGQAITRRLVIGAGVIVAGLAEVLAGNYLAKYTDTLGTGYALVVPYVVMLVVLLVRPYGLFGTADKLDRAAQLAMIDLNVRALTDLSLAFIDSIERRGGGILNVASVAGFLPGPGMAVYYATKAYVLSFSEALHHELAPRGVRVTVLCPGPVPTEFQARAGVSSETLSPLLTRSAGRVAADGYRGLKEGRRVVVPGFANKVVNQETSVDYTTALGMELYRRVRAGV